VILAQNRVKAAIIDGRKDVRKPRLRPAGRIGSGQERLRSRWAVAQKPAELSVDNVFVLLTRDSLSRLAHKELFMGRTMRASDAVWG
jgi:hypothetical protein